MCTGKYAHNFVDGGGIRVIANTKIRETKREPEAERSKRILPKKKNINRV